MEENTTINIQPPVSVYATYRRLSYKPWFAIAEFVDNSTQNYFDHKEALNRAFLMEDKKWLEVIIDYDEHQNSLTITDNANGMEFDELQRAIVLDKPPQNPIGRSEFGMGLKTAACWFGESWTITTTRLGSDNLYKVTIDVNDLKTHLNENIPVEVSKCSKNEHYTELVINKLYKPLKGKTNTRIKDHLSSIYRQDLRSDVINIIWGNEALTFDEPNFLVETHQNKTTRWKKDLSFDFEFDGYTLSVSGWVGIRHPGNQRDAGFVLLRKGRVIIGGPGEGYKPVEIFGAGNSFRSQRLFGELNLDNWPVSQAKDTFDWTGGLEDRFIEILKEKVKDYSHKAEGHREKTKRFSSKEMEEAALETKRVFESEKFTSSVSAEVSLPTVPVSLDVASKDLEKLEKISDGPINIALNLPRETWSFKLFWQYEISDAPWMGIEFPQDNEIHIFLNANHSFFEPYINNLQMVALIQKLVVSLALAEKLARNISTNNKIDAADFRNYMNWVLKYAGQIRDGDDV